MIASNLGPLGLLLPYNAARLKRVPGERGDIRLEQLLSDDGARVLPLWNDQCLIRDDTHLPAWIAPDAFRAASVALQPLLLGLDGEQPVFAVDLTGMTAQEACSLTNADQVADIRAVFGWVDNPTASLLAYARGLTRWHRDQRFCGACGNLTAAEGGGSLRRCKSDDCGRSWFPRVEPAVIVLVVEEGGRRCLLARHRAAKTGRGYAAVAGFVEIGESLEGAVIREVEEEVGLTIVELTYSGSQAWPFPAGLMVGYRARAADGPISVDNDEISEANWFTRTAVRRITAHSDGRPGRPDSIERHLLTAWLTEAG